MTKITAFHEKEMRKKASKNEFMKYFNVSLFGLRGKLHPAVTNIYTAHSVKKVRPHIKMLVGDYLTFEKKSEQSGGSPFCKLCDKSEPESLVHLIANCSGLSETRDKIKSGIDILIKNANLKINVNALSSSELTQLIIDPTSMNLKIRVNINHKIVPALFQLSRDFCYAIDRCRAKLYKQVQK